MGFGLSKIKLEKDTLYGKPPPEICFHKHSEPPYKSHPCSNAPEFKEEGMPTV